MAKKKTTESVRSRNKEIRKVKVSDLEDAPWNFRFHSDAQTAALEGAIDEIGMFGYPDVYQTAEGKLMLCDGHLRKALYVRKYGANAEIEVNVTDFDETEAKKATLTKDPIAAMADTNGQMLSDLMSQVDLKSDALLEMLRELQGESIAIEDEDEPEIVEDEVPEPPENPITKPGDLWLLGDHRVLCGDSTKADDMERLMAGAKANCWITDPPYNVNYSGGTGLTIENDNMHDAEFRKFLVDCFKVAFDAMKPGASFYIWHADSEGLNFRGAVADCGQVVRQCLIWVKSSLVMGRQDYHWIHEPSLYGWKKGGSHRWYYDRTETTVIDDAKPADIAKMKKEELVEYALSLRSKLETHQTTVIREPKPSRSVEHPTMKPVKLIARLVRNSTKKGDLIIDSFLGSGTTLVAAEQMKRTCHGLELSPAYCDVIVHRWEALTGQKAILEKRA
jgi:DNA modification methylase